MFATLSIRRLIVVPAVITLAVTLLRLVGELQHWSPRLFSREAGGAGALVGIVWLVPIFGIYFAIRLSKAGQGPASRGRAIGFAVAALLAEAALVFAISSLSPNIVATIVLVNLASLIPLWIAYRGWPELGRVEAIYGLGGADSSGTSDVRCNGGQLGYPLRTGASRIPGDEPGFEVVRDWVSSSTLLVDSLHCDRWIAVWERCVVLPEEPPNQ